MNVSYTYAWHTNHALYHTRTRTPLSPCAGSPADRNCPCVHVVLLCSLFMLINAYHDQKSKEVDVQRIWRQM
ncbi:hypothetical protein BCR43DRAFT_496191, partial [Syncephalastrum racemosum]